MKRTLLFSIAVIAGIFSSSAQKVLTLAECEEMALNHNKEIQAAARQRRNMEYTMKSARGNFFPNISANALGLYSNASGALNIEGGNLPVLSLAGGTPAPTGSFAYFPGVDLDYKVGPVFSGGIQLEQPIYWGGKIRAGYKMSKLGLGISQENERLTASNVRLATANAYAMAVKAQEMDSVAVKYKEVLTELYRNVESGVAHGMATANDLLKVRVRLNEVELMTLKSQNAIRLARMNLCHTIGLPLTSDIAVESAYPAVDRILNPSTDITSRPEYRMLESQVAMASQQIALSRADMLPQIGLQAGYSYANGLKINGDKFLDDGIFNIALSVKIPLYTFGTNSNKVKAAKARKEQLELEREFKNEEMQLQLTQAINNLSEMMKEAEVAGLSLDQAAENMRVSGRQYSAGMETLTNYLEAQVLWQQAYQAKVETHYKLYTTYMDYLHASGQLN